MERVNEQLYQANIDLVDKNKLLEEDKRILQKRINKAIEELEQAYTNIDNNKNVNYIHIALKQDLLNILKGRYVDNE